MESSPDGIITFNRIITFNNKYAIIKQRDSNGRRNETTDTDPADAGEHVIPGS
ncbi:hypothetical protein K9M79_00285 [Candidatus Woesearchaeota archaeon]|nr:hypothetical protein [Candidatus Woesearchaeota archaeon]